MKTLNLGTVDPDQMVLTALTGTTERDWHLASIWLQRWRPSHRSS